jgi:hypothetical protein
MDIGEHSITLPTLSDINEQVDALIRRTVRDQLESLLLAVAEGEKLSHKHLKEKYLPEKLQLSASTAEDTGYERKDEKKSHRKMPDDSERCLAKISHGGRCTRKRRDMQFCGSHSATRKYGEFIQEDAHPSEMP